MHVQARRRRMPTYTSDERRTAGVSDRRRLRVLQPDTSPIRTAPRLNPVAAPQQHAGSCGRKGEAAHANNWKRQLILLRTARTRWASVRRRPLKGDAPRCWERMSESELMCACRPGSQTKPKTQTRAKRNWTIEPFFSSRAFFVLQGSSIRPAPESRKGSIRSRRRRS